MSETHLKGLDALRAICASFLVLGHTAQTDFVTWSILPLPIPECCAYVFFVISGFLAGYKIESISSARSYFKKKAQRLLPPYFFYIALTIVVYLCLGRKAEVVNPSLWYYIALIPEIPFCLYNGILPLVHLWFIGSLILFHIVFYAFSQFRGNRITGATVIIVFWFSLKLLLRFLLGNNSFFYHFVGVTCFDVLFLGVLGGIAFHKEQKRISELLKPRTALVANTTSWLLFLSSGLYGRFIPAPFRPEFISVLVLITIITQQALKPTILLENRLLTWLNSISYEIYVFHILLIIFLSIGYSSYWGKPLPGIIIYLLCLSTTVLFAWGFKKGIARFVQTVRLES